jgi:hypothetical protein
MGMIADKYLKNPVEQFAHKYDEPPIAKCIKKNNVTELEENLQGKNWTGADQKNSEDALDRLMYFISYLSPHNLWKAREAVEELLVERDRQFVSKLGIILTEGHGGGSWRRLIEMLIESYEEKP